MLTHCPAAHRLPFCSMRVEGACASGGLAFASAVESIRAGMDIGLVAGAEVQNTVSPRRGGEDLATASHFARQRPIDDFTFPALFASRMKSYIEHYGANPEHIAAVSVKAYANGNLNPLAHMRDVKMALESAAVASDKNPNFLSNADLKPWLKVSDCSQVSDGGAAMVVVSEEGLKQLGKTEADAIEVLGLQTCADDLYVDGTATKLDCATEATSRVYSEAGVTAGDIGVAEVHDCFSIAEVLMTEAAGWAPAGQGAAFAAEGNTSLTGKIPVNTGGGLIAFGHPVGATGVKQILEVYRQMKGQCGDYQLAEQPELGMSINMGGDDKTIVTSVLKNL